MPPDRLFTAPRALFFRFRSIFQVWVQIPGLGGVQIQVWSLILAKPRSRSGLGPGPGQVWVQVQVQVRSRSGLGPGQVQVRSRSGPGPGLEKDLILATTYLCICWL